MRVMDPDLIVCDPTTPNKGLALAGTQYSRPVRTGAGSGLSLHFEWDGTPTTSLTLWSTNKPARERDDATDNDWVQETSVVIAATGGAAGKQMIHVSGVHAEEVRVRAVTTGGAGNMKCWAKAGE